MSFIGEKNRPFFSELPPEILQRYIPVRMIYSSFRVAVLWIQSRPQILPKSGRNWSPCWRRIFSRALQIWGSFCRNICERYFEGAHKVKEYDIAVEALGRRAEFDPKSDSIVRVEAHRLRNRPKEYYEHDVASLLAQTTFGSITGAQGRISRIFAAASYGRNNTGAECIKPAVRSSGIPDGGDRAPDYLTEFRKLVWSGQVLGGQFYVFQGLLVSSG